MPQQRPQDIGLGRQDVPMPRSMGQFGSPSANPGAFKQNIANHFQGNQGLFDGLVGQMNGNGNPYANPNSNLPDFGPRPIGNQGPGRPRMRQKRYIDYVADPTGASDDPGSPEVFGVNAPGFSPGDFEKIKTGRMPWGPLSQIPGGMGGMGSMMGGFGGGFGGMAGGGLMGLLRMLMGQMGGMGGFGGGFTGFGRGDEDDEDEDDD